MTVNILVILNAYGGRLGEEAKIALVEDAMKAAGLDYHLELTQYAGHATELAQQAIRDRRPIIVAAGGDGTIHEVINGLLRTAEENQALRRRERPAPRMPAANSARVPGSGTGSAMEICS